MHPRHFFRNPINVGAAKAMDRRVTRIARSDLEAVASPDPTPSDDVAAAEHNQVEPGEPSEVTE